MLIEISKVNLIATIILGVIWLAVSIWIVKEIIDTFKWDKGMGILEALLFICYSVLIDIQLLALLFGIDIGSTHTPIILPMIIR